MNHMIKDTPGQTPSAESRPVELTREIQAPIDRVWQAFSTNEMIREWWGPENWTSPKAEIDFTEGGKFLFGMKSPEGEVNWSIGTVKKIEPNRRIVFEETFGNEHGEPQTPEQAGLKDWPGDYHGTITVDFEELGRTRTCVKINHLGIPKPMHEECVDGWESCLNKLQKLVERH